MHHLVFGIDFQIHFVSLINPVSIHLLIHYTCQPILVKLSSPRSASFTLSFQAQNLPFQQILSTLTFLLTHLLMGLSS